MYSLPVNLIMCSLPEHFYQYIMEMFLIGCFFFKLKKKKGTHLLKMCLNKEEEEIKILKS